MILKKKYNRCATRAEFSLLEFKAFFSGQILDVGAGGSKEIYRPIFGDQYIAADFSEDRSNPDVIIDSEENYLPFKDGAFDTVLCMDCLEHCDNFHEIFSELLRVSNHTVILSLPNCWSGFIKSMFVGRNYQHTLGYGLAPDPPPPGARHKWYFNSEEAEKFVRGNADRNGFTVEQIEHVFLPGNSLITFFGIYPLIMRVRNDHFERLYSIDPDVVRRRGKLAWWTFQFAKRIGAKPAWAVFRMVKVLLGAPMFIIDELVRNVIWGWGSKYRYLNVFCSQFWAVLRRRDRIHRSASHV